MIVHKFGGTSVGNAERISNVADIVIENNQQTGDGTLVVVSAMSGVTDQLIQGARLAAEGDDSVYREIKANLLARHLEVVEELLPRGSARLELGGYIEDRLNELERFYRSIAMLGELTARGRDAVVSFGEHLSANILAAVIRKHSGWSEAISATELIVTDDCFGEASPNLKLTRQRMQARIKPLMDGGSIPVVTGFVGATEAGVPTTLGRGGSDYSAAIIGASLDVDEVWIWSDVAGILTADPDLVPSAETLAELSYQEAADLAYYGADVLHPKTIRPVIENKIPLRILNSFDPDHPGTLITSQPAQNRGISCAIISTTGLTLINVGSHDDFWNLSLAARALQCLSHEGVTVLMFSQSFSERSLNLIVSEQDQAHSTRVLKHEFSRGIESLYRVDAQEQAGIISVVGLGRGSKDDIVPRAFAALGKCGTQVISVAQPASNHSVSVCIPQEQVPATVEFIYQEMGLDV